MDNTENDRDAVARTIAELNARVAYLEDRQAIVDLMTTYGPAVDAGSADAVARVWTSDGVYDVDTGVMCGREEIATMVRGDMHQGYVRAGCAHIMEPGRIRVDRDTAVATGKSMLIVHGGDGFTVLRATANRWELVRTDEGWKCARRIGRVLDGRSEARELLASAGE
ncbi:nuclear transport factor 2 family protein [Gordonia sp. (in: high G+C Gram-positive bacteria)]|uniref:nuclear transport factor 2 family protein n=1 Tax=Gordonia sp. (in: high G+C Gram-positive bacteria) TaxID=84139 RepID=UPI003F948E29